MRRFRLSISSLALISLSACGGGGINSGGSQAPAGQPSSGSGSGPAAPTPPSPTPEPSTGSNNYAPAVAPPKGSIFTPAAMQPIRSASDTPEFRQNYAANELTNMLYAHTNGWSGQGVTVGVLDDGVATNIAVFEGQVSALSKDFGYETRGGVTTKRNSLGDSQSDHGTAVAAIISAKRNTGGTVGVAPDSKIAVLRTSDNNYDIGTETLLRDAEALDYATSVGIKVINRSLSSQGFNVALRNAATRYGGVGGILINAAGNNSGLDPKDAVNVDASNRSAWLFVVALDPSLTSSYALASYSNKAGTMADRAVTAVGTNYTTNIDGAITSFSGTSSATAQVTGLAANILSKWPQLTGQQAGQIILDTARDIGDPGVDAVFGHGLIDAQAALSPVNPTISNGVNQTAIAQSVMVIPEVLSTESMQTALSDVTILDQYGRHYSGSLANLVVTPESGRSRTLARRIAQMTDGGFNSVSSGPFSADFAYASYRPSMDSQARLGVITFGEVAYRSDAMTIRMGVNAQGSLQNDIMGLAPFADGIMAYVPQAENSLSIDRETTVGRVGLSVATGRSGSSSAQGVTLAYSRGGASVRASWIAEYGSVMGQESRGGVALARGTRTIMIEGHYSLGLAEDWLMESYGSVGITRLRIDPLSVVTGASLLLGTRAGIQVKGPALGGLLSFGIAQPLNIERGRARLTLGSSYDANTLSLSYRTTSASLASERRRLQITAGFAKGGPRARFRLGMMHDAAEGSTQALASFFSAF